MFFNNNNFDLNQHSRLLFLSSTFFSSLVFFTFSSLFVITLKDISVSSAFIGLLLSIHHIILRCLGPIYGILVAKHNIKNVFLISYFVSFIGYISIVYGEIDHSILTLSVGLIAFGKGLERIVSYSILFELDKTSENYKFSLTLHHIILNGGSLAGPILASILLYLEVRYKYVFLFIGSLEISIGLIYFTFLQLLNNNIDIDFNCHKQVSYQDLLKTIAHKKFFQFLLFIPLIWILYFLIHAIIPMYFLSQNIDKYLVVKIFIYNSLIIVFLTNPLIKLFERYRSTYKFPIIYGLTVGLVLISLSFFILLLPLKLMNIYIFILLFSLGEIFIVPISNILILEIIPAEASKEPYFGCVMFMMGIGGIIANLVGGYLLDFSNTVHNLFFPCMLSVIAMTITIIFFFLGKRFEKIG